MWSVVDRNVVIRRIPVYVSVRISEQRVTFALYIWWVILLRDVLFVVRYGLDLM
jgi:hypothetical protein